MNSRFRVNSDEFVFSDFFMNLVDRDLTVSDHSDTDVVIPALTSGIDKGNQTVHTHATR